MTSFKCRITVVDPKKVMYDLRYQRPAGKAKVKQLASCFDKNLAGVTYLSERANGNLYCWDGQHRMKAAVVSGCTEMDVKIYDLSDLTDRQASVQEAKLFATMNKERISLRGEALLRAEAIAQMEPALSIVEKVGLYDFNVNVYNRNEYTLKITSLLRKAYEDEMLDQVLAFLSDLCIKFNKTKHLNKDKNIFKKIKEIKFLNTFLKIFTDDAYTIDEVRDVANRMRPDDVKKYLSIIGVSKADATASEEMVELVKSGLPHLFDR